MHLFWRENDGCATQHALNRRGVIGAFCAERSNCTKRDNSRVWLRRMLDESFYFIYN